MKLFRESEYVDYEKRAKELLQASGINPENKKIPQGFSAFVGFDFGDIYIDDSIDSIMNNELRNEIEDCLTRFEKYDFGNITDDEKSYNGENLYLGCGKGLIGRYHISVGDIEINLETDETTIELK